MPEILDLGGGLGIRYMLDEPEPPGPEDYGRELSAAAAERFPGARVIFEPGRSLVARAGVALYRVGVVKRSGGTSWVAVDGGMSDNPRPALYGARYSALISNRAADPSSGAFAVCGKHCESGDVLIEQTELANPRRGDVLATPATGAYALSMASNYNAVSRPLAVIVRHGLRGLIMPGKELQPEAVGFQSS